MEYKGILKERETWFKVCAFLLAGVMLVREAMLKQWIYVPVALLVMLACFYKREQIISEQGVDIQSTLFGVTTHNLWCWDVVTTLHTDYKKAAPNVQLHIGKDLVVRTFVMKPADCKGALKLAAERNPKIYIEDLTEEEQARRRQERQRQEEVQRAQRAAEKHQRKK